MHKMGGAVSVLSPALPGHGRRGLRLSGFSPPNHHFPPLPPSFAMSRRSSVVINEDLHSRSLSRSSSVASSHLSRWSKPDTVKTPTGSRRGSLESHEGPGGRDPLSGHAGHLTHDQENKLIDFKSELGKLQVYFEGGSREEGGGKGRGRVDDSTLLYGLINPFFCLSRSVSYANLLRLLLYPLVPGVFFERESLTSQEPSNSTRSSSAGERTRASTTPTRITTSSSLRRSGRSTQCGRELAIW